MEVNTDVKRRRKLEETRGRIKKKFRIREKEIRKTRAKVKEKNNQKSTGIGGC